MVRPLRPFVLSVFAVIAMSAALLASLGFDPGTAEAGGGSVGAITCGVVAPNGAVYETPTGRVSGIGFNFGNRSATGCFMKLQSGAPYFGTQDMSFLGTGKIFYFGQTALWIQLFEFEPF